MTDAAIIVTTAPDAPTATALAQLLTTTRLAACVQIAPVASVYRWRGAIETADEVVLTIKTRAALFEAVSVAIKAAHPYETPEIVMTPVNAIDPNYHEWLLSETSDSAAERAGRP